MPKIGSAFHIFAVIVVASIAVLAAVLVSRIGSQGSAPGDEQNHRERSDEQCSPVQAGGHGPVPGDEQNHRERSAAKRYLSAGDDIRIKILFVLGVVMLLGEMYKQLFYYYVVNGEVYDWWFFPFQLCSVPMYLCLLLPFTSVRSGLRQAILTFMCGFTFVSAVAALAWPEDMLRPYAALTWHGFIWHGILLFISVMIGLSGMAEFTWKGFMKSVALFLVLCAIAIMINVLAEPVAASGPLSYPNMFYLSPYHASTQPIVRQIDAAYGRMAAMLVYTAGIIALAGVTDMIFAAMPKTRNKD